MSASVIHAAPSDFRFADFIEPVARRILGEPNKQLSSKNQLRFGTHGSVAVEIGGEKRGTWFDHEANEGGGVLDLIQKRQRLDKGSALDWLRRDFGADLPDRRQDGGMRLRAARQEAVRPDLGPLKASYDYVSADGELLFQVCRYEPGGKKTFRQRRPDGNGGWIWSLGGIQTIPYHLPELLAAQFLDIIFVVEGEKDVETLRRSNLIATCNPMGAAGKPGESAKWPEHFAQYFHGRDVVILPDNDAAGHAHSLAVAHNLYPVAERVRILDLPGLPPKGDVTDWLAQGNTVAALIELAAKARTFDPTAPTAEPPTEEEEESPLPLLFFDEITPVLEAKDFVQGVLAEGGAAVVYGESNAGKTFWATDLALHVAAGKQWNQRRVEQGGVIYCAMEGGHAFRNRVAAWKRHYGMEDARIPFAAVPMVLNLSNPEADTPSLIQAIRAAQKRMGQAVKLVVIDTLSRALAGGNENAPEDMGALVAAMDAIRAATSACVLFIHHSGKDAAKGARGHSLLRAAIDTEIEVRADESSGTKTATVVKQRDMAKGAAFGFRLEQVVLGQNQHGEDVTTCLVMEEEARQGTLANGRRLTLTETERGWLKDLMDAFAEPEAPKERVPAPDMPRLLTLTRDQIREAYRRRGRFTLGTDGKLTGADRVRLHSMLNKLKDKGKIGMTAELVWLL